MSELTWNNMFERVRYSRPARRDASGADRTRRSVPANGMRQFGRPSFSCRINARAQCCGTGCSVVSWQVNVRSRLNSAVAIFSRRARRTPNGRSLRKGSARTVATRSAVTAASPHRTACNDWREMPIRLTASEIDSRRCSSRISRNNSPGCVGSARHGRWRWALLLRRGAMMRQPAMRSQRSFCDFLRVRTTPDGDLRSRRIVSFAVGRRQAD